MAWGWPMPRARARARSCMAAAHGLTDSPDGCFRRTSPSPGEPCVADPAVGDPAHASGRLGDRRDVGERDNRIRSLVGSAGIAPRREDLDGVDLPGSGQRGADPGAGMLIEVAGHRAAEVLLHSARSLEHGDQRGDGVASGLCVLLGGDICRARCRRPRSSSGLRRPLYRTRPCASRCPGTRVSAPPRQSYVHHRVRPRRCPVRWLGGGS